MLQTLRRHVFPTSKPKLSRYQPFDGGQESQASHPEPSAGRPEPYYTYRIIAALPYLVMLAAVVRPWLSSPEHSWVQHMLVWPTLCVCLHMLHLGTSFQYSRLAEWSPQFPLAKAGLNGKLGLVMFMLLTLGSTLLLGVLNPALGCKSAAAYGATISRLSGSVFVQGYVYMMVAITVISIVLMEGISDLSASLRT